MKSFSTCIALFCLGCAPLDDEPRRATQGLFELPSTTSPVIFPSASASGCSAAAWNRAKCDVIFVLPFATGLRSELGWRIAPVLYNDALLVGLAPDFLERGQIAPSGTFRFDLSALRAAWRGGCHVPSGLPVSCEVQLQYLPTDEDTEGRTSGLLIVLRGSTDRIVDDAYMPDVFARTWGTDRFGGVAPGSPTAAYASSAIESTLVARRLMMQAVGLRRQFSLPTDAHTVRQDYPSWRVSP